VLGLVGGRGSVCGALSSVLGSRVRHRDIGALCDRVRQGQRSRQHKRGWGTSVSVKMIMACLWGWAGRLGALTRDGVEVRVEDVGPSADLRGALSVVKGSRGRGIFGLCGLGSWVRRVFTCGCASTSSDVSPAACVRKWIRRVWQIHRKFYTIQELWAAVTHRVKSWG
jgi:hypothetical protein